MKKIPVSFKLLPETVEALDELAKQTYRTKSSTVDLAIKKLREQRQKKEGER